MAQASSVHRAIEARLKVSHPDKQVVSIAWTDIRRGKIELPGGGTVLSCWGTNITDKFLIAKDGKTLYVIRSPNKNERIGYVNANSFCVVSKDALDPAVKRPTTLESYLKEQGLYCEGQDQQVQVRFEATFIEVDAGSNRQIAAYAYSYGTHDDRDPQNLVAVASAQGISLDQNRIGKAPLFLRSKAHDGTEIKHWLDIEPSMHGVGGPQVDSIEQRKDARKRGKAETTVFGTRSMGQRCNVVGIVQIPRVRTPPRGGTAFRGNVVIDDDDDVPVYTNLAANVLVQSDDEPQETEPTEPAEPVDPTEKNWVYYMGDKKQGSPQEEEDEAEAEECLEPPEYRSCGTIGDGGTLRSLSSGAVASFAARASIGEVVGPWEGFANIDNTRDQNQPISITVCFYYALETGGVPSEEDIDRACADLDAAYAGCESSTTLHKALKTWPESFPVIDAPTMSGIIKKLKNDPHPYGIVVDNDVFPGPVSVA